MPAKPKGLSDDDSGWTNRHQGLVDEVLNDNPATGGGGVGPSVPSSPRTKVLSRRESQVYYDSHQFDLTGQTGSYLYMAPEVFRGERYNHKADVFSFAMIMYELLHRQMLQVSVCKPEWSMLCCTLLNRRMH